ASGCGRAMDGRSGGVDHPQLVPAHAARTRLRQRQPVYPDFGNRPERPARRGGARLLARTFLPAGRRRLAVGARTLAKPAAPAGSPAPAAWPEPGRTRRRSRDADRADATGTRPEAGRT